MRELTLPPSVSLYLFRPPNTLPPLTQWPVLPHFDSDPKTTSKFLLIFPIFRASAYGLSIKYEDRRGELQTFPLLSAVSQLISWQNICSAKCRQNDEMNSESNKCVCHTRSFTSALNSHAVWVEFRSCEVLNDISAVSRLNKTAPG